MLVVCFWECMGDKSALTHWVEIFNRLGIACGGVGNKFKYITKIVIDGMEDR